MILVTGASGALGTAVLPLLDAPHALSRRPRTGGGATWHEGGLSAPAVAAADVILHLASDTRRMGRSDLDQARTLLATARPDAHLVYISIVGIDDHPYSYYRTKLEVERLIATRPHTILRATQFHGFVAGFFDLMARGPALIVPSRTPVTPVAVEEVAARLADLARQAPQGRVDDLGGPETADIAEFARRYLTVTGRRRPVLRVRVPGRAGRAFRDGAHADAPRTGKVSFADHLARR